ncbi:hypothetical protein HGO23_04030 [Xenorhabdus budapestensis]|uniref:Uncharacterized protein n=1 Tax=Xenorhabdus budapestensis TaxID=290110 RepID=A0ABX7VLX4_XENBU|nr:hypothetical protein [Xenorhabdus budapestensis]QTL40567.1 hypothetical protein HGO23_04030 [Xenorhabdus budapestensis]
MGNVAEKAVFFGDESVTNVTKSGITDVALRAAIDDGLLEIRKSTDLDAKTDPGSRAWGAVIRGLRRELLADNNEWSFSFVRGLNLTHNKAKGLNIIVMSGDKYTGLPDRSPKSKNPKGAATGTLVGENYDLFYEQDTVVQISDIDSTINYVLLYFFDFGNKEVRYELSIPIGMTESAGKTRIAAWKERNIFQAIPFIQKVIQVKEEFTEEPHFEVIRK